MMAKNVFNNLLLVNIIEFNWNNYLKVISI